jgi:galactokinase
MTQAELIAGIAERNAAIERFKKQLETETVRFEKLWTAIQLTNAETQQRLMYEEMIRRRKQRRRRAA